MAATGYFIFSLDMELGWGYFDLGAERAKRFSPDGTRERESIATLLEIFDEYHIASTWGVVGHLFYACCDNCQICPIIDWQGKYTCFADIYKTCHPLWYGADIIDMLLDRMGPVEIGLHGYTHRVMNDTQMSSLDAQVEVAEGVRAAEHKSVRPKTMLFPRNRVGHLDIFRAAGFLCYRGAKMMPRWYQIPFFGKALNRIDLLLQILTPPVYDPYVDAFGLVCIPESAWFFRINRRIETVLDALDLQTLRIGVLRRAVDRAANERKVVHIWAHPCEFRTVKDFQKLRFLLEHVAEYVEKGQLQSVTMASLAHVVLDSMPTPA